jgi:hypothetical protein
MVAGLQKGVLDICPDPGDPPCSCVHPVEGGCYSTSASPGCGACFYDAQAWCLAKFAHDRAMELVGAPTSVKCPLDQCLDGSTCETGSGGCVLARKSESSVNRTGENDDR